LDSLKSERRGSHKPNPEFRGDISPGSPFAPICPSAPTHLHTSHARGFIIDITLMPVTQPRAVAGAWAHGQLPRQCLDLDLRVVRRVLPQVPAHGDHITFPCRPSRRRAARRSRETRTRGASAARAAEQRRERPRGAHVRRDRGQRGVSLSVLRVWLITRRSGSSWLAWFCYSW